MAKTAYKNVDEYLNTFSQPVKERLETIRQIIKTTVPDCEEIISYQIPAYKYHGYLIYFSAYTHHISLSSPFSEAFRSVFAAELKKYTNSKSAIQFPNEEKLPVGLIKKMIAFRKKENEDRIKKQGS